MQWLGDRFKNLSPQVDFGRPQSVLEETPLQVQIESNRLVPGIVYLRDTQFVKDLGKTIATLC